MPAAAARRRAPHDSRRATPWPLYPLRRDETYVNVGFWSTVAIEDGRADGDVNRRIEAVVAEHGGHKSLYSDAYYGEDEFWPLYGGEDYHAAKKRYDPQSRLLDLYAEGGATTMTFKLDTGARTRAGAVTLGDMFEGLFGADAPVRFSAYDGSTAGDPPATLGIRLTNPRGVSYLATAPGSLGLARAYLKGDLEIEGVHPGDPYEMLQAHRRRPAAAAAADVGGAGLGALARRPHLRAAAAARAGDRALAASRAAALPVAGRHVDQPPLRRLQHVLRARARPVDDLHLCVLPERRRDASSRPRSTSSTSSPASSGLQPGMRLLDVGCGWGGMVRHAAANVRRAGARRDALRASRRPGRSERIKADGLDHLAEVRHSDYRDVRERELRRGQLDRADRAHRGEELPGLLPVPALAAASRRPAAQPRHHPAGQQAPRPAAARLHRPVRVPRRRAHRLRRHRARRWRTPGSRCSTRRTCGCTTRGRCRPGATNLVEHWDECVADASLPIAKVWGLYMAGSRLAFERNGIQLHQVLATRTATDGDVRLPVAARLRRLTWRAHLVHSERMTARPDLYDKALDRAATHARDWLADVPDRPVPPRATADEVVAALGGELPDGPDRPGRRRRPAGPARRARPDGDAVRPVLRLGDRRHAAGRAGRRLAGQRLGPEHRHALRDARRRPPPRRSRPAWLLDLLGLPPTSDVGFVTGGTMANFTGLAAGRQHVLTRAGWDLDRDGLTGGAAGHRARRRGPARHRRPGPALPRARRADARSPADDAGPDPAGRAGRPRSPTVDGPAIVACRPATCTPARSTRSRECIDLAHEHGAWVHVDGAFGLWAAASPQLRHLVDGIERADSWATDAHKTLNTPYDCGIAVVARPGGAARRVRDAGQLPDPRRRSTGDPLDKVPELSRRARGVPVWAALRSLGRSGVADLVDGLTANAPGDRRRHRGDPRRRDPQRRRLHPGVGGVRRRRADPGGHRAAARRRHRVDVRLTLARPGRAAGVGQQLVDRRGRRRRQRRRRTPGRYRR